MSYPRDLDQIPTVTLVDEILRREAVIRTQHCPYCGYSWLAVLGELQCDPKCSGRTLHDPSQLKRLQ